MAWPFTFSCIVTDAPHSTEALEEHFDRVLEELTKLGFDADITATLSRGLVDFDFEIEADLILDAMAQGLTALRTALHAAGASTPNWPSVDDVEAGEDEDGHWVACFAAAGARAPDLDLQDA